MPKSEPGPEVYSVTGVRSSLHDDLGLRMRRYLISMSVRTVCFVLAVVVGSGPLRWVFVAFAVFLPYVAVVMANAGRSREPAEPERYRPQHEAIESDHSPRLEN